jgi:molybdopterin converting factor small subunit
VKIIVKAFGSFRDVLGQEMELDLPELSKVQNAIQVLCKQYQEFCKDFNDETLIVLNGKVVLRHQGSIEPIPLKERDSLAIFPPVSGG